MKENFGNNINFYPSCVKFINFDKLFYLKIIPYFINNRDLADLILKQVFNAGDTDGNG